jgi:F420-dependent methylenetetrahydromethanopterin dehydrogenase
VLIAFGDDGIGAAVDLLRPNGQSASNNDVMKALGKANTQTVVEYLKKRLVNAVTPREQEFLKNVVRSVSGEWLP